MASSKATRVEWATRIGAEEMPKAAASSKPAAAVVTRVAAKTKEVTSQDRKAKATEATGETGKPQDTPGSRRAYLFYLGIKTIKTLQFCYKVFIV